MDHLDLWTDYSFMRAYMTPAQALRRAKKLGSRRIGIADYCSTWGHVPFLRAASKEGLDLALGVTLPVVADLDKRPVHDLVAIFPRDRDALQRMYELVGIASEQKFYRPRVTWEQLRDPGFTLIAYVVESRNTHLMDDAGAYVALRESSSQLQMAARAGEFPLALATAPCMASASDAEGHAAMMRASDLQRIGEAGKQLKPVHMATRGELLTLLGIDEPTLDRAIETTSEIFDDCIIRDFGKATLPPAPEGWCIRQAVEIGARERGISLDGEYSKRVQRELEVIQSKGFEIYFHFVSEICRWAKGRMLVGPGRGSAGGCLVAYLLGITNVDPLVHGTLFERFIDPTRNDMPDIDVDFQDSRRELVFRELCKRYGAAHVARIGTVSFFGGKSAINEVARSERHVPFSERRALGERADGANVPLGVLFEVDEVSRKIVEEYPELSRAALLDGHARHRGVHAAGVCVAQEPITRFAAVDSEGVAAVTLDDAEAVGLLKFDALGLTTLSVIDDACNEADVDAYALQNIPLDDDKVYEVLRRDAVTGVFQLEGHVVRGLMREIHVDRFSDLCALSSLARPGPLQGGAAGAWVKRRMGLEEWAYEHPLLEPITRETYGLIVYQEQVMKIGRDLAGFDDGQVNRMRKAVGKKKPEELAAMEAEFIKGAVKTVGEKMAHRLWEQICDFGSYAFNRAHSVAYSMLSYQCAWLKAYHPRAFALGLLRHCSDDDRAKVILRELMAEGVPFKSFDPDKSEESWSIKDGMLYGGFSGVYGIGNKTARTLLTKRAEDPEKWMQSLTPAMRKKLEEAACGLRTPWDDIDEIGRKFGSYFDDPDKHNVRGPVYRISDIPHRKGNYCAIAKLKKLMPKDQNDPDRRAKRGGREVTGPTRFLNMIWEDDGVEMGSTINRFKYDELGAPIEEDENALGAYYLIRGDILGGDGPKWLMIDKIRRLEVPFAGPTEE